jgi:uncharacterized protein (DUF433 family)
MIQRDETGIWKNPHPHHASKLNRRKQEGWGRRRQSHASEYGEQVEENPVSEYPMELIKRFADAMGRCPESISMDADVMDGQPSISGTRIPVRSVLRAIEHYGSIEGAIACYPDLTAQQVQDALFFSQVILELPRGDESSVAS